MLAVKKLLACVAALLAAALVAVALAIAFGGPGTPPPMRGISDPFRSVDFSDLPPLQTFICRGGDSVAFREYRPIAGAPLGTVVLVHGSTAHSTSMHVMARALAREGYQAYALDMRGHGASPHQDTIKGISHLEFDIEDFARAAKIGDQATLAGFSSGGGFVLRFAASERQHLFARYLLLAPFISQEAPTYRKDAGGWVSVGVPRLIALMGLNGLGIKAFNHLPVTRFAVTEDGRKSLTAEYSYALATGFRPRRDYQASIRAIRQPVAVIVGEKDELFIADRYAPLFESLGAGIPVTVVPGVSHIGLILDERAVQATIGALRRLEARPSAGWR
jgi:alpha-beta hydrolase superfamily lysophospholipase